jgi:hypothetical protein
MSPQTQNARRIDGFADLDGLEFLAKIEWEKDPFFCSMNNTSPERFSTTKSISPKWVQAAYSRDQCTPWKTV